MRTMKKIHSGKSYSQFLQDIDLDSLYDAIGFDTILHVKGNDIGHCLFPDNHANGDTTGKMAIHRSKKVYNCWVCGGGSLLSLVMQLYDYSPEEANHWLRQFTIGDRRSSSEFVDHLRSLLHTPSVPVEPLPYFNPTVLDRFDGPTDYFKNRGISDQVIAECRLCYSDHEVRKAPSRTGDDDYEGPGAIFPHFYNGQLVGWQTRWLEYPDTPRWLPKYTNTTSFPKNDTLYNYDWSLEHQDKVVICESVPTVLFLRSIGVPSVAYFGDVPSDYQLKLMRRFSQGVILSPDNDHNGDRLLEIATEYLEPYIDVWSIPKVGSEHGDLGDYAVYDDAEALVQEHLSLAELAYIDRLTLYNR